MVPAIIHTHVGTEYVKRAGALYTITVPLGSIEGVAIFCIVLSTLNKRAYAQCEIYAQLPGVKPTDVPDWRLLQETHTYTNKHTHKHTQTMNKSYLVFFDLNIPVPSWRVPSGRAGHRSGSSLSYTSSMPSSAQGSPPSCRVAAWGCQEMGSAHQSLRLHPLSLAQSEIRWLHQALRCVRGVGIWARDIFYLAGKGRWKLYDSDPNVTTNCESELKLHTHFLYTFCMTVYAIFNSDPQLVIDLIYPMIFFFFFYNSLLLWNSITTWFKLSIYQFSDTSNAAITREQQSYWRS